MCAQWKAGVSHQCGFYKVIAASVWMVSWSLGRKLIFAMKGGGQMVFSGVLFVSLPASSKFFVLIYNCEFLSELLLMAWALEV